MIWSTQIWRCPMGVFYDRQFKQWQNPYICYCLVGNGQLVGLITIG